MSISSSDFSLDLEIFVLRQESSISKVQRRCDALQGSHFGEIGLDVLLKLSQLVIDFYEGLCRDCGSRLLGSSGFLDVNRDWWDLP